MSKKPSRNVFIRTVTYHYAGQVLSETKDTITLIKCCWVADSGRFTQAMETGNFGAGETEPYPADMPVTIFKSAIVDMCPYCGTLPIAQK